MQSEQLTLLISGLASLVGEPSVLMAIVYKRHTNQIFFDFRQSETKVR